MCLYFLGLGVRHSNTLANDVLEKHRKSDLAHDKEQEDEQKPMSAPREFRYLFLAHT